MNFNVRIGTIDGGAEGLDVIVYKMEPSGRMVPPTGEENSIKCDIECHLKEFNQAELREVAGYVKWKVQRLKDETGKPYLATTGMYLYVDDENFRDFGRKVYARCHLMFPFVKVAPHKGGMGHARRRRMKSNIIGWDACSVNEWAEELSRMEQKMKGNSI